jgi:alkylation response protein AidB-like acyl-CoA dehydrogenase
MNFGFSEEQEMLRDGVRRFLRSECPTTFVRKMMEDDTGHSTDLWRKLTVLGWPGVLVPGRFGGLGGRFLDAVVILEEMGKALLPGPYLATAILAATAIARGGTAAQKKALLPRISDGTLLAAVSLLDADRPYDPAGLRIEAKRKNRDWMLSGENAFVLDATTADWLIVAARTGRARKDPAAGITLFVVEASSPSLAVTPLGGIDRTRRAACVSLDRVVVPERAVLGRIDRGWPVVRRVLDVGAVAIAVETVGVAQRALEMSVDHARERVQFGRPIGSFQAVKHKCVDMMVAIENARSLAYHAAWTIDEKASRAAAAIPMAAAYCGEMGKNVTGDAIQVHGGIGFTWEHDVHLYYRRALANESTLGPAPLHREMVARQLNL